MHEAFLIFPMPTPPIALQLWSVHQDTQRDFAATVRTMEGLTTAMTTRGGAQDSLVVDGAGTLAVRMAERLADEAPGGRETGGAEDIELDAGGDTENGTPEMEESARV